MTDTPRIVILYNDGMNAYLLASEFARAHPHMIIAMIRLPAVPISPKTDRPMKRTSERLRQASIAYLLFNALVLHGYALLSKFGKGSLRRLARELGIAHADYRVADDALLVRLREARPGWILNFSSLIIKPDILSIPEHGVLNYHGAPLPAYRGAGNFFWMLADGMREVRGTFHYVDEKLDTGSVIAYTAPFIITPGLSVFHLWAEMRLRCFPVLERFFLKVVRHGAPRGQAQDEHLASQRSFPTREAVQQVRGRGHPILTFRDAACFVRLALTGRIARNTAASTGIEFMLDTQGRG